MTTGGGRSRAAPGPAVVVADGPAAPRPWVAGAVAGQRAGLVGGRGRGGDWV